MKDEAGIEKHSLTADEEDGVWSIGIYAGQTLCDLKPAEGIANPVISAEDVDDVAAEFVADPFMIRAEGVWHMFFEVMNRETGKGEIGLATSQTGVIWDYRQIVLREPFHLSYPYVFCRDGGYFMVPETLKPNAIRLYRGDPFPDRWSLVGSLMQGAWADPSICFYDGRCWMFVCPADSTNSRLELYYSDCITGPWRGHGENPLVRGDERKARPGGRVTVIGDKVIRFAQDCYPEYGSAVRAFEITEMTTARYAEREVKPGPVLSGGSQAWNRCGMHHLDPHWTDGRWLACVDGWGVEKPARRVKGA